MKLSQTSLCLYEGQKAQTLQSNQSNPPNSAELLLWNITQPRQERSVYVIAPHPRFLFDSSRTERAFNDTGLIVFSALVQYGGINMQNQRGSGATLETVRSIYSYEMSNVLEVRQFFMHRCADMITEGLLQGNP